MLKNYLIAAYRNLAKHRVQSIINILGLAVGMGVALLNGVWVGGNVTFDRNFPNYDRIGVIWQNTTGNGKGSTWNSTPWPMGDELRRNYPQHFWRVARA